MYVRQYKTAGLPPCCFFFVVRRIGMTKPPVKLGVGKKFLEKRKEPPSGKMKLVWQPQHFNIGGSMSMNDVKSLSHSKWRCKNHIVFAPKCKCQYKNVQF